jgi:hypothetical protein
VIYDGGNESMPSASLATPESRAKALRRLKVVRSLFFNTYRIHSWVRKGEGVDRGLEDAGNFRGMWSKGKRPKAFAA